MNDYETLDEAEAAIEALFNDFKQQSFPDGWETAVLEAATLAPVIRLTPDDSSTPSIPDPTRVHTPASFWTRHRLTAARLAAAIALVAGGTMAWRLLPGGGGGGLSIAADPTSTTASPTTTPTTTPVDPSTVLQPTTSSVTTTVDDPIENQPEFVTTTTAPRPPDSLADPPSDPEPPSTPQPTASTAVTTTIPSSTTITSAPVTSAPVTSATTPSTAAPPATSPPTTVPLTTVPPSTTSTTTPSNPADVAIRGLTVGKITATSAVVSFSTNDCSGARYQISGGINTWADGFPNENQCWNNHFAILGRSPFSSGELAPGTKYIVRITTYAPDGTTANARVTFKTLPLELEDPPVVDAEVEPAR